MQLILPGPSCSKYWIKLSTGQLLIQWRASQWITLVVQKQRQWLARFPLDKILSMDNSHNSFHFLCKSRQSRPKINKINKGLLSSATFQIIFQAVQFICCDLQMIYDQSFFNKEKKTRVSYIYLYIYIYTSFISCSYPELK